MALAGHENRLLDARRTVGQILPRIGFNRDLVGQFIVQALKDFLARDFSGQLAQRRIRNLVFGIKPRPGLHHVGELFLHGLDAVALQRRNHERVFERAQSVDRLRQLQQLFDFRRVDLVEHQCFVLFHVAQAQDDFLRFVVKPLAGVDQQAHHVRIPGPAPGGDDHRPIKPALGAEDAGRIHKDDLCFAMDRDAAHLRARGLHFARHDGDFRPDQRIEQRRLAGVGRADERDKAAAGLMGLRHDGPRSLLLSTTPSRVMKVRAAACSARRLEAPSACVGANPEMSTSITNFGACAGPERPASR